MTGNQRYLEQTMRAPVTASASLARFVVSAAAARRAKLPAERVL
jgi:hypothetical protein